MTSKPDETPLADNMDMTEPAAETAPAEDRDTDTDDPEDGVANNAHDDDIGGEPPGTIDVPDPDAYELDFNHCRLNKIQNLENLTQIETISFRWNQIKASLVTSFIFS